MREDINYNGFLLTRDYFHVVSSNKFIDAKLSVLSVSTREFIPNVHTKSPQVYYAKHGQKIFMFDPAAQ